MKQIFKPADGYVAVVREAISETEVRLVKASFASPTDSDTIEHEKWINPWALVVGVGDPQVTLYGTKIKPPCQMGDKVAITQVGKNLPLVTSDGAVDYVYVLPFEGVMGRIEARCENVDCGKVERAGEGVMTLICPKCGDGRNDIIEPTLAEVSEISRGRL